MYGRYAEETGDKSTTNGNTALCGDAGHESSSNGDITNGHEKAPQILKDFIKTTLKGDGSKNWPTSSGGGKKDNDNAEAVAKDLVALNREEKTIVAGLLARTIEGGEVVEIRAVSLPTAWLTLGIEIGVL
ncbi:hypothetical protein ANAPC3_01290 [Anaplasma phagocytophilum]|nr:hypothetical protein ANAPC2_00500 [Anaplasma phagocytophilum]SBO33614.1 hypothetical protein ANAPC3_01290 [Anaplasma phagocytophilum]SBO33704.1 hypothetical protein ANAPC4_01261 [Anaplasma phagocytophilum]